MRTAILTVATLGVVGLMGLAGAALDADANDKGRQVRPAHGLTLDVGSKHTVSYFVADGGKCNLTLMLADKPEADGYNATVGTRMTLPIDAGRSARIETNEGKSLDFSCAAGAHAMSVRMLDMVAYAGRKS